MIDFSMEKELVNRNYRKLSCETHYHNNLDDGVETDIQCCWVYSKKGDECSIVSLDHDVLNSKWILSYPMKNSKVNYRLTMETKDEVAEYIRFLLSENALE